MNKIELRIGYNPNNLREIRVQMWNHLKPLRFNKWAEKLTQVNLEDYEFLMMRDLSVLAIANHIG